VVDSYGDNDIEDNYLILEYRTAKAAFLDGVSGKNTQLEVGRPVAADAIIFVSIGETGERVNIDCKLVDVEARLMIAGARKTYPDIEKFLENLAPRIGELRGQLCFSSFRF